MKKRQTEKKRMIRVKVSPSEAGQSEANSLLRFAPLLIIVCATAVYASVLTLDIINFDDKNILRDRFFFINNLSNLPEAFTTDAFITTTGSMYRPLQTVSFMIEAAVGGGDAANYHLTSLVLHVAACLLIYWLLLSLGYRRENVVVLTLLYTVHPVFVSTVSWIPSRGDQLLTIFVVLSLIIFIRSIHAPRGALPYLHGLTFLLAFLAKETAIVIPVLCIAVFTTDRSRKATPHIFRTYAVIWIAATAIWYLLRMQLDSVSLSDSVFGIRAFIANVRMIPETIGTFFLPINLKLIPQFNTQSTVVGIGIILLLALGIIRSLGRSNLSLLLGPFWFLACLVPVMTFRNPEATYYFDYLYHRSFLTDIGLIILMLELLQRAHLSTQRLRSLGIAAGIILVYFGYISYSETQYFHDPYTFFTEALLRSPTSALCYNNRGAYLFNDENNPDAAISDFNRAIRIFPSYAHAYSNRGNVYKHLGEFQSAEQDYTYALRIHPNNSSASFNRAELRYLMNDYEGALSDYDRVLARDRLYPRIWSAKAGCLAMLGRLDEAVRFAEMAMEFDPNDEQAYNSLGTAKWLQNDQEGARKEYQRAVEIQPKYSRGYNNLGVYYFTKGDLDSALFYFSQAIDFDTLYADAYSNRGFVFRRRGQTDRALKDLNRAIAINPGYANAYLNRGGLYNELGKYEFALVDFDKAIQLNPRDHKSWRGRGIARHMLKDYTGACIDWQRALDLGSEEVSELLSRFCKQHD